MLNMNSARTLKELKHNYRRLVSRHHPDKGGNLTSIQKINNKYQRLLRQFTVSANNAFDLPKKGFYHLQPGSQLFGSSTACKVLEIDRSSFLVTAKNKIK
jgi:hypothetical protein